MSFGVLLDLRRRNNGAVRNEKRLSKWQKGRFTKHYFEGASRIVSKLGEGTFQQPTQLTAGGIDYIKQSAKMQAVLDNYIRGLNVPPGPPTQQGIYAMPEYTKQPYPQIDWEEINQNQEPPEGWPRAPKFNEPGDVPGPPVQFGPPIKPETVEGGYGFKDNGIKENNIYFYHPDHLGSSSYLTDINGRITQHTEYIAFGEVLFDEHNTSTKMPYLFNGKELDSETGLYYYGARYYDSKVSLWLGTDPLSGYNPIMETEHYIDGQHNGGIYNPMNMATYSYTYQNPVIFVDPNGKQVRANRYRTININQRYRDNRALISNLNRQGLGQYRESRYYRLREESNRQMIQNIHRHDRLFKPNIDPISNEAQYRNEGVPSGVMRVLADLLENKVKNIQISQQYNPLPIVDGKIVPFGVKEISYGGEVDLKLKELDKIYSDWAWKKTFGEKTFEEAMYDGKNMLKYKSLMLEKPSNKLKFNIYQMIEKGDMIKFHETFTELETIKQKK
ncbi:hypothetical protein KRX57_01600 [Weeksellaceae bacterium TAE3-ERU29]|nr:hypothetical protein [Weeksellaceae bacterium TAE3-ERU29]